MARSFVAPGVAIGAAVLLAPATWAAPELASPWTESYNSKSRLLAGRVEVKGQPTLVAGIELSIAKGWKTYWRTPGDSGGVPPNVDLAQSENVASFVVLYPAPHRLPDPLGDAIGYKDAVTLPVAIVALDASKPVVLNVQIEYGICREICVPAEARLTLTIPPGTISPAPAMLAEALAKVPAKAQTAGASDPVLKAGAATLTGEKPKLTFEISFPGGKTGGDLFVEAPDGIYLPLPRKVGETAGSITFEIDLASGLEAKDLQKKTLTLTAVSDAGQSEITWLVE